MNNRGENLTKELIRAARGRRSQLEFSRRLGYRSNIVRRWEGGECWPTASDFLGAYARLRPALPQVYAKFFQRAPDWLDPQQPFSPTALAAFLQQLKGKTPVGVLAQRTGHHRYGIGRWLRGTAQPKLPELLNFIDAASRRALDFVALVVDPKDLPTFGSEWKKLQSARHAAYESPWSHAVLRALELEAYANVPASKTVAWLAERLSAPEPAIEAGIQALAASGQIQNQRGRWRVDRVQAVDTGADATRSRELKATWARVATERLAAGGPGNFGYSLFAISRKDLVRLRDLHLEYVRAMQNLIAESRTSECVGLYCAQLLDLATLNNALSVPEKR
jgi:hypothetical protein